MGAHKLKDEHKALIAELREQGYSYTRIQTALRIRVGVTISTSAICWQCARAGVLPPKPSRALGQYIKDYQRGGHRVRAFTPEEDAELLRLEAEGLGPYQIGKRLDPPRRSNSVMWRLATLARIQATKEQDNG